MEKIKNSENLPLVSIVTPTYNSRETLEDTLESVSSQDYPNIEHVVVDGGSKDGTIDIIKENAARGRINKWVSESDKGIYDAMNKGVKMATGEIVAILNADDFYASETSVSSLVRAMTEAGADAAWGDIIYVDEVDTEKAVRKWKASPFGPFKFLLGWHPPHPAFFVRREVYEKFGLFREDLRIAADYEFMLRVLKKGKISSVYIPKLITKMRVGGASHRSLGEVLSLRPKALRAEWQVFSQDRAAWKLNGLRGGLMAATMKPLRKMIQLLV